jgi:hypothetical protein
MGMNQGIAAVAGTDVLIINGVVITGHADGDAIKIEPQGPISQYKISKDGNTIIALQNTGLLCKLTVRLVRACADDVTLNGLLQQWIQSPSTFPLLAGSYVKNVGDGKGNTTNEIYVISGGTFEMIPGGHSSMDGSTEQSVTVYTFWFRNDARLMQ